mgnify:CR=1 FL=1
MAGGPQKVFSIDEDEVLDLKLSSKVVLVTGSSSGLGLAIARTLHEEGCNVIINGRSPSALAAALASFEGRVTAVVGDVTSNEDCQNIAKEIESKFSKLDILICNVGSGSSVPPGEEDPAEWGRMFGLNFFSATNMIEASKRLFSDGGSIVCVSSICGLEVLGAPLTYSSAKAALNHYVKGIARPLAEQNIRVNAIAPGNLLFEGSVWEKKIKENETQVKSMLEREVSLSRLGNLEEIAKFVTFLSSPVSSFSTGQIYVVDGGQVRS